MPANQDGILNYGAPTRNPFNYAKFEQIGRDISTQWLTTQELANQLNLFEDESQDGYLEGLELAVRQAIEDYLGLSIFPTQYRVWYNVASLFGTPLALDLPEVSQNQTASQPGVTINAVKYWTGDVPPVVNTVAKSNYFYDASGNRVVVNTLPTDMSQSVANAVFVDYTTAASPLAQYPVIKQAGLLLFTHLYNNRSNTTEASLKEIPFGVATLLRAYRPLTM